MSEAMTRAVEGSLPSPENYPHGDFPLHDSNV